MDKPIDVDKLISDSLSDPHATTNREIRHLIDFIYHRNIKQEHALLAELAEKHASTQECAIRFSRAQTVFQLRLLCIGVLYSPEPVSYKKKIDYHVTRLRMLGYKGTTDQFIEKETKSFNKHLNECKEWKG